MEDQSCTNIAMELGKAFFFRQIRVPNPDSLINAELSSQIAIHPSVGEIHEVYVKVLQML